MDADKGNAGFYVHYISASFQDLLLVLQVKFYVFVVDLLLTLLYWAFCSSSINFKNIKA